MKITRFHYTDLFCAALNGGPDTMEIFKKLEARGFEIDEVPKDGEFYMDCSIMFMYPHKIQVLH
jgi:hypothetical protein